MRIGPASLPADIAALPAAISAKFEAKNMPFMAKEPALALTQCSCMHSSLAGATCNLGTAFMVQLEKYCMVHDGLCFAAHTVTSVLHRYVNRTLVDHIVSA